MGIKVIVTGATGMVGEGVMHECLHSPDVEIVLILNRRPSGFSHPKLQEIVHSDLYDLSLIQDDLQGFDACYFCLGTSSVGKNETEYRKITYDLTMHIAQVLSSKNPQMVFCYISGAGTDSSEKGRLMWARVKGKTENDLMRLPFKKVYAFRPGFIEPTPGMKNTLGFYKYVGWLIPMLRKFFSSTICSLRQIGQAMINVTITQPELRVLEVKEIIAASKREQ